jgi:hypothetical protein
MLTSIALMVGLVLVIWELRQARDATLSELASQGFQIISQTNNSILGEEPIRVLTKACDSPDTLTREDLLMLRTYYQELMSRQIRIQWINKWGGFYSDEIAASTKLGVWYELYYTKPGRAFWRSAFADPELRMVGDRAFSEYEQAGAPDCSERLDSFAEALNSELLE